MLFHQLGLFELQEIFSWLSGNEICTIWLCGYRSFNERIVTKGGVRKLDIVLPANFRKHVLPPVIQEFSNLEALHIEDLGHRYVDRFTSQHLLSLPSRLTSLKFFGHFALHAFLDALEAEPSLFNNLKSLSLQSTGDIHESAGSEVAWPPNLTFLEVFTFISPLDLAKLPRRLIHLSGDFGSLLEDGEPVNFPESLTTIEISFQLQFSLAVLQRLPQGDTPLTSLHINHGVVDDNDQSTFFPPLDCRDAEEISRWFPRNLTSLRLKVNAGLEFDLNRLPRSLTRAKGIFRSQSFFKDSFAEIPDGLKDFCPRIPVSEFAENHLEANNDSLSVEEIIEMRGIPSMHLTAPIFAHNRILPSKINLPMSLKRLTIHYVRNFGDLGYSLEGPIVLPPGLTELVVVDGKPISKEILEIGLPPNLLSFYNRRGLECEQCFKLLPRTLTSLEAAFLVRGSTDKVFSVESSLWLPPALTTLTLMPISITSLQWISGLPKTLTDAQLRLIAAPQVSFDVPERSVESIDFPPSLTNLRLFLSRGFERMERIVEHLPRKLQDLRLSHESQTGGITDAQASAFPRFIYYLVLTEQDKLTEKCRQDLPPCLSDLMLGPNVPEWFGTGRRY